MNFTREPIIETVITPREGCKLVIRSSKGNGQEEYFVDAIEVVSFGHSFFFRSQERPKSFLVPMGDYEVLELKETRMVLKNVTSDRSIKIGGGREVPPPSSRGPVRENVEMQEELLAESRPVLERSQEMAQNRPGPMDRKRDNKRRRGRRGRHDHQAPREGSDRSNEPLNLSDVGADREELQEEVRGPQHEPPRPQRSHDARERPDSRERPHGAPEHRGGRERSSPPEDILPDESSELATAARATRGEEPPKAPSFISKLFPPPPTLIKESLSRYKPTEPSKPFEEDVLTLKEKTTFEETVIDHPVPKDEEDNEE